MVEAVAPYLERADYKGALKRALKIESPIRRMIALTEILTAYSKDEVLALMFDALDEIKTTAERALAYSILGRSFYILNQDRNAELYFERAMAEVSMVSSPLLRGEVLAGIARNLVLSDRYEEALGLFREAVELLQASRGLSAGAVSSLLKVGRLIERSADEIPNEIALEFYKLARSVYSSLNFKLQVKYIEEKIELINEVLKRGMVVVEDLIRKGEVEVAMSVMRFLPLESRAIAMLELSYWLFLHEQPKLARKSFEDALEVFFVGKFHVNDAGVESVARRFLRVGFLEEALVLAGIISDEKRSSELLGDIVLAYWRRGETGKARSILEGIPDEGVKKRVLSFLEGGKDVGHEQGLPLTGGGEERGAVPEDGGAREVQGEVEQKGGTTVSKGNDSGDTGDALQLHRAEGAD